MPINEHKQPGPTPLIEASVYIMSRTFKENCLALRNTNVVDIINVLQDYGIQVGCNAPWINSADAEREYSLAPISVPKAGQYDGVVAAVAHSQFVEVGVERSRALGNATHVLYD